MKGKCDIDRTASDGTDEEKYRDRGSSASGRHKIICEEQDGPTHQQQTMPQVSSPDDAQQIHKMKLRAAHSPRRPVSYSPSEASSAVVDKRASLYSSGGSDVSVPVSPYRRRHAGGLGSSQTGERPRVSVYISNIIQNVI